MDYEWFDGEEAKVKEMGCLDCSVLSGNSCLQLEGNVSNLKCVVTS